MRNRVAILALRAFDIGVSEEAITNTLVAANTMTGADGFRVFAVPHAELQAIMQKYNRLLTPR